MLSRDDAEVCVRPPGFAEDLVVTTDTIWLVKWQTGAVTLAAARRSGHIRIDGPPSLVRAFGRWGGLSPFAHVRPAADRPPPNHLGTDGPAANSIPSRSL